MNHFHHSENGFTLLELILSLTLSALVVLLLITGSSLITRNWHRQGSVLDEEMTRALSLLQIERALTGAFPHLYKDTEEDNVAKPYIYFEGGAREVRWVSTFSPLRQKGLAAWRLAAGAEGELQLYVAPVFADNPDARLEAAPPHPVVPGYSAVFQYLVEENREKKWVDEWSARKFRSLPLGVYVRLIPLDRNSGSLPFEITARIGAREHASLRPVPYHE